jgi:hypothetical protein
MSDIATKVPELTETTFITWRPLMESCLCQRGLWRVVIGELLAPSAPTLLTIVSPATALTNVEIMYNTNLELNYNKLLEAWNNMLIAGTLEVVVRGQATMCHLSHAPRAYILVTVT